MTGWRTRSPRPTRRSGRRRRQEAPKSGAAQKTAPAKTSKRQEESFHRQCGKKKVVSQKASEPVNLPLRASATKQPMPHVIHPMLATLVDEPFDDDNWLFEIKWDGYRAIAFIEGELRWCRVTRMI